jgi:hypothetical protein
MNREEKYILLLYNKDLSGDLHTSYAKRIHRDRNNCNLYIQILYILPVYLKEQLHSQ